MGCYTEQENDTARIKGLVTHEAVPKDTDGSVLPLIFLFRYFLGVRQRGGSRPASQRQDGGERRRRCLGPCGGVGQK